MPWEKRPVAHGTIDLGKGASKIRAAQRTSVLAE